MKKYQFVFATILMFVTAAIGQDGVLTLDECVDMALKTHPAIQAAEMARNSATYQKRIAVASALPSFKMEYSHTWIDPTPVIKFPSIIPGMPPTSFKAGDSEMDSFTVSATQPLFTGGATISAWRLAKLNEQDGKLGVETARMEVTYQTKNAFYGVLKAKEFVAVGRQAVEMAESLRKRAQDFYDVGMVAKNQLLEAQVGVDEARQTLITAESSLSIAKSYLNMMIGRSSGGEDIDVVGELEKKPFTTSMDDCIKKALADRPEVNSAKIKVEMAEKLATIERSGMLPWIAAVAAYQSENGSFGAQPEVWSLTLAATWTFFEWGKKYYKVKSAKEMVGQAKQAQRMKEDEVTLEVKQAYYRLRMSEAVIEAANSALVSADENLRVVQAKFDQNMATSFDVITAQTFLTRARTSRANALADYMTAYAALERAMGVRPVDASEPADASADPSDPASVQPQPAQPTSPPTGDQ